MQGLLIIDIQNDYFPGGAFPLAGPEEAAAAASRLLAGFRSAGGPVVHLQHVWDAPDAEFMRPGTEGVEINAAVAPRGGELVLTKEAPNGFLGTGLETELRNREVDQLVVAGMMTSTCVDATVRAAADLGFEVTLAHDACAAPDLEFGGITVPAASVHAAFVAAMAADYADARAADEIEI
ncbi:MAG: cysteine hydrolase family protein [Solirubrobacterales bacterium]